MRLPDSLTQGGGAALAVRLVVVLLALMGAGLLAAWGFDLAQRIGKLGGASGPSPEQQVLALQTDLGRLRTENAKLTATIDKNAAATKDAAATAEKLGAAIILQEQQARQIKALELENGTLKAEAAATAKLPVGKKVGKPAKPEGAVPVALAGKAASKAEAKPAPEAAPEAAPKAAVARAGIAPKLVNHGLLLRRFEAELVAPRTLHYRLLLSQPATAPKLAGRLQLVVTGSKGGKPVVLNYPPARSANASQFVVKLGQLQRCEGQLALPEGVIVKSLQARVLEKGQVRIARSVTLKDAAHVRS